MKPLYYFFLTATLGLNVATTFSQTVDNQNSKKYLNITEVEKIIPPFYPTAPQAERIQISDDDDDIEIIPILKKFFKKAQGSYVDLTRLKTPNKLSLYTQFVQTLYDTEDPYLLPSGNLLYIGKMHHDWNPHSAIVTQGYSKQVLATALYHFNCGRNNGRKSDQKLILPACDNDPTLTIFYSGRIGSSVEINEQLTKFFERFAKQEGLLGQNYTKLKVEIRVLN
jgi:hypothetical protein